MRWVGLVRNVMLGREGLHRDVLLHIVRVAGGKDVRNHLTTGNVTFSATDAEAVALRAEDAIADIIGRHEPVILRRLNWLQELVADDPFTEYRDGSWELAVGFLPLTEPPFDPATLLDPEPTVIVRILDRELITARPREGGRRPDPVGLLERATGTRATGRAWSTLERIARTGDESVEQSRSVL